MSHEALSSEQMANVVNTQGGGSFNVRTGAQAKGPGFMVGQQGSEERLSAPVTSGQIDVYRAMNAHKARHPESYLGFWQTDPRTVVGDVSRRVSTGMEARNMGAEHRQEAAFALPGTVVNAGGKSGTKIEDVANSWGGDVLLNTNRISEATEADPRYARTADANSFNLNEVQNPEWSTVGGQTGQRKQRGGSRTPGGKPLKNPRPVSYEDVLRTINRGRTNVLRNQDVISG
jgi:hypothetical protein